jgi:RimJ/RimL family protein N-acetyltransferase
MSVFPAEMESDRLRYERVHPDDLDHRELYEHLGTDAPYVHEITHHLSWDPYDTAKDAFDWVQTVGGLFDRSDAAHYVVRPKEGDHAGELAGVTGITPEWDRRRASIGVWFRKPFWGRGYSGERAGRLMELAFEDLGLDIVYVTHGPDNEKSRRAIERYVDAHGGRREGLVRNGHVVNGEPRDDVRYSISREEWAANRD